MAAFKGDEETQNFFANLCADYFDDDVVSVSSFNSDIVSMNDTAELFNHLEISIDDKTIEDHLKISVDDKTIEDPFKISVDDKTIEDPFKISVDDKTIEDHFKISVDAIEDISEESAELIKCKIDDKTIEDISEESVELIECNIDQNLDEYIDKWRKLNEQKREFFKSEIRKMKLSDELFDRMVKFNQKWNNYENDIKLNLIPMQ